MAEPQPKQSRPRPSWSAIAGGTAGLVTALAALIGSLAAVGVIGGSDDDPAQLPSQLPAQGFVDGEIRTAAGTTGSKTPVTFTPTPDEERLLRVIPADIQPSCTRPDATDTVFPADVSLFCNDPALVSPGYVRFVQFDSAARLAAYEAGRRTLGNEQRRCGTGPSGSAIYRDADGQAMGRLVCYLDKNGAWIEWTNDDALVYGVAYMPDSDWSALYDFWARVGPIHS